MTSWRLLDTGVRSAAENMALDEVMLRARGRGSVPDTLRFLQFSPEAVLVGYHQAVDQEVRVEYCRQHGIDINRRITGGGAIYFDRTQIGWEIVAGRDRPLFQQPPDRIYRYLAEGAIRGLRRLGVEAAYRPVNDIEVRGRKISGTGGTERGGAFLFQGTLLVDFPVERMLRALRLPGENLQEKDIVAFRQRVTCLREELGTAPPADAIKQALAAGFAEVLQAEMVPAGLHPEEEALLPEVAARFEREEWILAVRRPEGTDFLVGNHKAPSGLIRVVLHADTTYRRIKQIFITGDFFAFPQRLVADLEAWLKNAPLEEARLGQRVHEFFAGREWCIPGVTPEDFTLAILQAAGKPPTPATSAVAPPSEEAYRMAREREVHPIPGGSPGSLGGSRAGRGADP